MKKFLLALFLIYASASFAQSNQLWSGYFSYNRITDLTQSDNKIVAASENALFTKNLATNVLSTTTTIDGLAGETISAIHFSSAFNQKFIGYDNGLMIKINETDGSMLNIVDILNKQLPSNIKRINHFTEHEGILYISCDFGIVQYDIATLGFGDTYFIGTGVPEIVVKQTAVHDGYIYAATRDYGIKRAEISNPDLIDATQWTQLTMGNYSGVEMFADNVFAVTTDGQITRWNGVNFAFFNQLPAAVTDFRATEDYLVATVPGRVTLFDQSLNVAAQFNNWQIPDLYPSFTAGTVVDNLLYIGTLQHGVVTTDINNPTAQEILLPAGPLRNYIFSINASTENLWAVYGGYDFQYTPWYNPFGFSKYTSSGWVHIPYAEIPPGTTPILNLSHVSVKPDNSNEIYISSYFNGLLKFSDTALETIYNGTNSAFQPMFATDAPDSNIRVGETAFDRDGNLWAALPLVKNALVVLRSDGSSASFNVEEIVDNYSTAFYGPLVVDKNKTVWFGSRNDGLIAFNENGEIFKRLQMGSDLGDLPSNNVRSLTIDNRNQLWIGTAKGLRVLSSVDRFNNDAQMTANAIIIEEEGLAQELLYEQFITDIAVDGANNKWIGTADSGIYMVSPNGQETKYHFTVNNSPLPSNVITDIEINGASGEVFIATEKGMISFKGISTKPSENLNNVIVYPNPVRPEFFGTVKIGGLIDKATIKITDIEGNLVYEVVSEGGTIEWDTTAFGKYRVASGVYMIFISAEDGSETKVKKVMIIR